MVALLTILGTIFLIVSMASFLGAQKLDTINIVIGTIFAVLMTLCYVGAVFAQYITEFMK